MITALKALYERRKKSKLEIKIDNSSLPAGSPMYFYCHMCGQLAEVLPEDFTSKPKKHCDECQKLLNKLSLFVI
jgi:NAD-dependent SIR2 family protein deacetylase